MEISDRLVQVGSSAKIEEYLPIYTVSEMVFLFGDVFRPVGLILNHNDPTEYFVLCPTAAPMQVIYKRSENTSWLNAHMQLLIKKATGHDHKEIYHCLW